MNRINPSKPWKNTNTSGKSDESPSGETQYPDLQELKDSCDAHHQDSERGTVASDAADDFSLWSNPPQPRSFFLPLHYTPSYRYPVIIWFHHSGFNEHQIDQIMPHLSLRNYIGIGVRGNQASDSAGHRFTWHDSPAAIDATQEAVADAIADAKTRFSIDLSRLIFAGYQTGGTMAQRLALRAPKQVAGVISMGGLMPTGGFGLFDELRERKLPMLWQWSSQNPLYNQENIGSDCKLAMSISADVEIRQYVNEDEMNTVTLKDANDWIMRKIISGSAITDSDQWSSNVVEYSDN